MQVYNDHNSKMNEERRLVSLLKQGDDGAFRELIRKYRARLLGIAYGTTLDREESQDIVQEVFLKVYQNIRSFRGEARLSTWLYRITLNQCLNWKRRWIRKFKWQRPGLQSDDTTQLQEIGKDTYDQETLFQVKEYQAILREALSRLPEEARAVLVLKDREGLSYDEIANALGINKGTVSSRLFYARQQLRESLRSYSDEGSL